MADSDTLILRTDLEPDVAEAQLDEARACRSRTTANLLFERSETSAAPWPRETRTPRPDRDVASWLIIIAYLWFRFKSLTYGLAAVIAVVHDVLITLGAVAVTYWLVDDPGRQRGPADRASSRSTCR